MLAYPQLMSGALSQFPAARRRRARTVVNSMADGSAIKMSDPAAGTTEWQLSYTGLSDSELASLQQFFQAAEGSLNGFTFLDPSANLLAWSEDLGNSSWQADPQLKLQSGVVDALGGKNAWQLANAGGGPQSLSQTLNAPGGYVYCFSFYLQATQVSTVTLTAGNSQKAFAVGSAWRRFTVVGSGDPNGVSVVFGIAAPAGATIDVFGPQAEAQQAPSIYQTSTTGGVYTNTRFRDDTFSFTTQAENRHSTTVNLFYASHL